jgi:hypothetical protein
MSPPMATCTLLNRATVHLLAPRLGCSGAMAFVATTLRCSKTHRQHASDSAERFLTAYSVSVQFIRSAPAGTVQEPKAGKGDQPAQKLAEEFRFPRWMCSALLLQGPGLINCPWQRRFHDLDAVQPF